MDISKIPKLTDSTVTNIELPLKVLDRIIDTFDIVADEIVLNIDHGNIEVAHVDPAHICFMKVNYKINRDITCKIKIDTFKYIRRRKTMGMNPEKNVTIGFTESNHKCLVVFRQESISFTNSFSFTLDKPKIPALLPSTEVNFNVGNLSEQISSFESVIIQRTEDELNIICQDDDSDPDAGIICIKKPNGPKEPVQTLYSVQYLSALFKAFKNMDITLKFGNDYPIIIVSEGLGIEYFAILAPRVEND